MKLKYVTIISCLLINTTIFGQETKTKEIIEIKYIANEGVLITNTKNDSKVLIDALFPPFFKQFDYLSGHQKDSILNGQGIFNNIDIVAATHMHKDHFGSQEVGVYLKNNSSSKFIGSNQIIDRFKTDYKAFDAIKSQIIEMTASDSAVNTYSTNDIKLTTIKMDHVGNYATTHKNMAFVIEMGSSKILHVGDANLNAYNLSHFDFENNKIDILIAPYFHIMNTQVQELIATKIKPSHILITHLNLNMTNLEVSKIENTLDNITILRKNGDKFHF